MSGLVLKLGAREQVVINGALVENWHRRGQISILTRDVSLLRMKDALTLEEAVTPVRRVYYSVQMVLACDADADDVEPHLIRGIEQLAQFFDDNDCQNHLRAARQLIFAGQHYRALRHLKVLLPIEDKLILATRK